MPNCRTCRGEYTREECICPSCGEPVGKNSDRCQGCDFDLKARRLCPRCKSDVSVWEREELSLLRHVFAGGILGLGPTLVAAILWLFVWNPQEDPIHLPVGSGIGILLSLLVFGTLFSRRYDLREMVWAAEVHRVGSPSLPLIGTGSFLMGLLLMVSAVLLNKLWQPPIYFEEKLIFSLVYGLMFVGFTAGLSLLPLGAYLTGLDKRVPQPIFVHTDRLVEVVLQGAASNLRNRENGQTVQDKIRDFEILQVTRDPADGSIELFLRDHRPSQPVVADASQSAQAKNQIWVLCADKWGRIRSVKPRH